MLDAHSRELYASWRAKARDTVADLRRSAAHHPDDDRQRLAVFYAEPDSAAETGLHLLADINR